MISLGEHASLGPEQSSSPSSARVGSSWIAEQPSCLDGLTTQQESRLADLLEQYMQLMQEGLPPSLEQLTADTPELCEPLRVCVGGLESLHRLAGESLGEVSEKSENRGDHSFDQAHRLGDFQLHEAIGRGGMGVVYRATQLSLGRTVAVKVLPLAAVLDPRQLLRFQHEAEAAASLQHPNIVPVHSVGCDRGVHYYAMRFIDGQSLAQWIDQTRAQSSTVESDDWRTSVRYAIQVAKGIHAAHELGIVHRDIKPSNLMLDRNENVWITDFGLARIHTDKAITGSHDILGTIQYMSPEQASGESAIVDGRTDIYSLAVTLYEMLALRPVHDAGDVSTLLSQMDRPAITPLHQIIRHVPRDLDTVVAKAMAPHRNDRYETALEFADDLSRVLAGEPTIARPPSIIDRAIRFATRHRNTAALTSLIAMLALAGFAIGTTKLAAAKKVSDELAMNARHNEAIAREAVDRLGTQISDLLADIPEASAVRQRLLHETLGYYQQIAAAAPGDNPSPDQLRDLAMTYGKMGVLQSELPPNNRSLDSLRESQRIYHELAQSYPADRSLQLLWSISQNNLAGQLAKTGDVQEAATWFERAIRTQDQLFKIEWKPATAELAKTLNNLGKMLADAGQLDESRASLEQAIGLLADQPSELALQSSIRSNLAGLLAKSDPKVASELARDSLSFQLKGFEQQPLNAKQATKIVLTLNTLAIAQSQQDRHHESVRTLKQAIEIGERLNTRWPDQPTYRRDLVICLNQLGLSYSALDDWSHARVVLDRAVEHANWLKDAYGQDAEVQHMLGGVFNNLAFVAEKLGHARDAAELYRNAISYQETAIALAPQVTKYQKSLRTLQQNWQQLRGRS